MHKKEKILIDISQLEPVDKLDKEELALHKLLEQGKFELKTDKKTLNKYAQIFKHSNNERKALSLRMPKKDYLDIKAKALELGLPYQALINSLVHRFLTGELREA
jgi:predicted DNA binding CopG/RHH family protein